MTYQVLARKWRPQLFSELIGQEPIVTALRNALSERRIAQAYLFSGIRGVGKTTAARLLAKALNCERGPTPEPCNECAPCRDITAGSDLDVLEVDAATYSKVEQVRELTESLKYGPARDRYKVAVLDEVHRLSRQAFDALLKIVEEPPRHLVFIFATTESESVPATILSRCQEFHFRRVPAPTLASYLRTLCDAEKIAAGDAALRLIARAGEGSVRDAVALLDQLATFGSGTIADEDAARLLGGLDTAFLGALLAAILAGRAEEIGGLVGRIEDEGWDPRHAYNQFLAYCRDALHLALAGDGRDGDARDRVDLPEEEAAALAEIARRAGYENLLRLLQQLLASEATVRRSESAGLALEIALLRAAELPKLIRVEEILGGAPAPGGGPAATPGPAQPPPAGRRTAPRRAAASHPPPAPDDEKARPAPPPPEKPSRPAARRAAPSGPPAPLAVPTASPTHAVGGREWERFLEEISRRKPSLAAHLSETRGHRFADSRLTILVAPGDAWLDNALRRASNRQQLDQAAGQVWGEGVSWTTLEGGGDAEDGAGGLEAVSDHPGRPGAAPESAASSARHREVADIPAVQTVLELFHGRVETVEERGGATED